MIDVDAQFLNPKGQIFDKDRPHLGGNSPKIVSSSYVPNVWKYVIDKFSVKTAIDLGGGMGFCAKWFNESGVDCINVDGLQLNINNSVIKEKSVVCDLTENAFQSDPVDLVNCIEVVEHIDEQYLDNLLDSLSLGKLILMTHGRPGQPGYHHVNNQPSEYWIECLKQRGYTLLENDSNQIRKIAKSEGGWHIQRNGMLFSK